MNKTFKDLLIATLIPLGLMLVMCITGDEGILLAGIAMLLCAGAYVLIGIICLLSANTHWGKVLMLSAGIILLVGFSTCGLIMNGMNFH
ncbi:hypothetical protein FHW36_10196 [Chitinophaga polysaccharea]|uniref:Uncharacterized protein n=1 Tax=Chitinophaga polysaccharea TaxID=1293035 RepID=A0A561Q1D5_9BACT|nr:hypothetical protein [Chitinophaga polysaccharea]TWF44178.1 hypothetical protein FHW36_10196 [Chitinophaga polysaccharea]